MPDFRVAHLSGRQADIVAGGVEQRVRTRRPEAVEGRRVRLEDRVVGPFLAPAPAIEDDKHHGAVCRHFGSLADQHVARRHAPGVYLCARTGMFET